MFESTYDTQKEANLPKINQEDVCVHHKVKQTQESKLLRSVSYLLIKSRKFGNKNLQIPP